MRFPRPGSGKRKGNYSFRYPTHFLHIDVKNHSKIITDLIYSHAFWKVQHESYTVFIKNASSPCFLSKNKTDITAEKVLFLFFFWPTDGAIGDRLKLCRINLSGSGSSRSRNQSPDNSAHFFFQTRHIRSLWDTSDLLLLLRYSAWLFSITHWVRVLSRAFF